MVTISYNVLTFSHVIDEYDAEHGHQVDQSCQEEVEVATARQVPHVVRQLIVHHETAEPGECMVWEQSQHG